MLNRTRLLRVIRSVQFSRRGLTSAVIVSVGSISSAGFAFLAQAILARTLLPGHFGEFTSSLALVNIALPLAAFGAPQLLLQVYGKDAQYGDSLLHDLVHFSIITTIASIVVLIAWLVLIREFGSLAWWLLPVFISTATISLSMSIAQVQDRMMGVLFWQNIQNLTRFLVVVVLMSAQVRSPLPYAVGYGVSALIIGIFSAVLIQRYVSRKNSTTHQARSSSLFEIGGKSWKYGIEGFFYLLYYNAAVLIISAAVGSEPAGFYAAAVAVLAAVYLVPSAVFQRYMLPKLHHAAYHNPALLRQTLKYGSMIAFVFGCVVLGVAWVFAERIVLAVFGKQYLPATDVFKVLLLGIPIKFATFAPGAVMATGNSQVVKLKIMGGIAALNVLLVYIFSQRGGVTGAAIATVITDLFLLIALIYKGRNSYAQH